MGRKARFWLFTSVVSGVIAFCGRFVPDGWALVWVSVVCIPICLVAMLLRKNVSAKFRLQVRRYEARLATPALPATAQAIAPQSPPVLYLRSFDDDRRGAQLRGGLTEEEHLGHVLGQIGPFVAVGRPGEPLPEAGASRFYLADADWQVTVRNLMQTARLVVIRTGRTQGLGWEVKEAVRLLAPERLILLVDNEGELLHLLSQIWEVHQHVKPKLNLGWRMIGTIRAFVVFDPAWQPRVLRLKGSGFYEYQQDSWAIPQLSRTLRPVFIRLGSKWRRPSFDFRKIALAVCAAGAIGWGLITSFAHR